jgi:hypothetical protein
MSFMAGLAPESVKLATAQGSAQSSEMTSEQHFYILRPEVAQPTTGNQEWTL